MKGQPVRPPGPRGPRPVAPPGRRGLAVAVALSGRTLANIADHAGCSYSVISKTIAGTFTPSARLQARLAELLGVRDVNALFALATRATPEHLEAVVAVAANGGHPTKES